MACCIICDRPDISIHALLAESDVAGLIFRAKFVIFLSTLSLRRATSAPAIKSCWSSYFYPRSPCGERLRVSVGDAHVCVISIHALLAESDQLLLDRGLTRDDISIHALLAESDTTFSGTVHRKEISIHALLAESDSNNSSNELVCTVFLSTLSLRRATPILWLTGTGSIHFYPRSPCGERPVVGLQQHRRRYFYPRSPCGERHIDPNEISGNLAFLSTLSLRRATVVAYFLVPQVIFLSTLSLRRATPI